MIYGILFFATIACDQLTKWYARTMLDSPWSITSFLRCELVINRGISLSFFDGGDTGQFIIVTLLVTTITLLLAYYTYRCWQRHESIVGEILVLGASCSNILDRIVHGGVIDFIGFHCKNFMFPVFNIADVAIVLGIFIMFFKTMRNSP